MDEMEKARLWLEEVKRKKNELEKARQWLEKMKRKNDEMKKTRILLNEAHKKQMVIHREEEHQKRAAYLDWKLIGTADWHARHFENWRRPGE